MIRKIPLRLLKLLFTLLLSIIVAATFCPIAYHYRNKFAFKTEERAEQFGNQFINIVNEFFSNLFIYKIKMIIP